MKAYISKHPQASFNLIPKFHKWGKYRSIRWWKRELVIYLGSAKKYWNDWAQDEMDKLIRDLRLCPIEAIEAWKVMKKPGYEDAVHIHMRDFVHCFQNGIITSDDGTGYFADINYQSNIALDLSQGGLLRQGEMFTRSKKRLEWYPTHVVWYYK